REGRRHSGERRRAFRDERGIHGAREPQIAQLQARPRRDPHRLHGQAGDRRGERPRAGAPARGDRDPTRGAAAAPRHRGALSARTTRKPMDLTAVVMAAGHGTRMKSARPKVLHEAAGRPLVYYPIRAALDAGATRVVVVVNPSVREGVAEALRRHLLDVPFELAVQETPRGTGDAAR